MSHNFRPSDVFWGQLGGAMEAIDSGTTTVVDYSHVLYSPEHGMNLIHPSLALYEDCCFS